jgi:hypothetical protein
LAKAAAALRVEKIDFHRAALQIRTASHLERRSPRAGGLLYPAYRNILRCMPMMEGMPLIPGAVSRHRENHGHRYTLLGTPERLFIQ